jgi:hypothetical protein
MVKKRLRIGRSVKLRGVKSLGKIKRDVKDLKKMVNKTIENKQQTYNSGTSIPVMDIGMFQRPTLNLTQGTADGDARPSAARVGNSVTLLRTQLKMQLRMSTSGLINTRVRLLVVESVNGNEALDLDDILQAGGGTLVGTDDNAYTSCYTTKTATNKRYKLHYDKVINLSHYGKQFFFKTLNLRYGRTGKVINYDGNNQTPTDYNLQILAIGDQSSVGVAPHFSYSIRSTYKDA